MGRVDRLGHHVTSPQPGGVLAGPLSAVLEGCGMVSKQPGGGRRHDRGPLCTRVPSTGAAGPATRLRLACVATRPRRWGPRPAHAGLTPVSGAGALGLATAGGLVGGSWAMVVHWDRRHRIQQLLERVIVGALFVYVVCSVISISAMQTAYILALVAWALRLSLQGDTRQLCLPLLMPVSAFVLASILATILAVEPLASLLELRNVFEALVFYLIVNQVTTEARATTLVRVLMVTTTIMALYGLCQSFTYGVNFRVRGTMDSKMTFAGLLMLVDLMTLAHVLFRTHCRQLMWTIPALLLITAALLMTQTRSAWCGLMAGGCVLCGLRKKVLLLALPLGALVVFLLVPQPIKSRALSIADRRDITAQERLSMWASGVRMIRDHPWTGVGMGAMERIYPQYREPDSLVDPTRRIGHLHNNIIQLAAERGLLGLACWLWLWGAYGAYTWRMYAHVGPEDRRAKALVLGSLASVIGFHIEGLFEHTFGDSEVITLTYFLMALPFVVQRVGLSRQALDSRSYWIPGS